MSSSKVGCSGVEVAAGRWTVVRQELGFSGSWSCDNAGSRLGTLESTRNVDESANSEKFLLVKRPSVTVGLVATT
jgi:hypothetical protein